MSDESAGQLAQVIKYLAKRTGKTTQEAQAKHLGISDTALSKYLSGEQVPREKTFIKMLTSANVPQDQHPKHLAILKDAKKPKKQMISSESGQSSHVTPVEESSLAIGRPSPSDRRRAPSISVLAALGAIVACVLIYVLFWGRSSPSSEADAASSATPSPAVSIQCSLVESPSSPVYAEIGDPKPVKFKSSGDRVRLLPMPARSGADGAQYQAVALPDRRDSSTGVGWMPKADLKPDPRQCEGLGKRP